MEKNRRFEAPGTRLVFWVYAGFAWAGGLLLFGFGPWLGVPYLQGPLLRVAGTAVVASGLFSAAMAQVADDNARRRGMLWFAAGHFLVWLCLFVEYPDVWNSRAAEKVMTILFIPTLAFLFFRQLDNPDPSVSAFQTLFGGGAPPRQAGASRYEREIREAAGREERNRLARDLHDSIKQQLFAIQTAAATAQTRFEPDPEGARSAIAQVRSSAREAMTEMEVLLDQLRAAPLENVGVVEALKRQCEATGFRTGAKVAFSLGDLPPNATLPPGAQQALFRVAQEALANVARHARAANLKVALGAVEGKLKLTIEDDGAGFDPETADSGMGIRNMRERAAEFGGVFELASSPGGGTRLSAAVPFTTPATRAQYTKNLRNEGLTFAAFVGIAMLWQSGVGLALIFGLRFFRALAIWLNRRAEWEAVR